MSKFYPLADWPNVFERKAIGWQSESGRQFLRIGNIVYRIKAVATGEKRPPKRGEWYLSGAIVEAYKAPNDLSVPFKIAKLVLVKEVTHVVEQEAASRELVVHYGDSDELENG